MELCQRRRRCRRNIWGIEQVCVELSAIRELGRFARRQNTKSVQEVSNIIFWNPLKPAIYERAGSRIRTDDLLITNQLLYQLSYAGAYPRRIG